MKHCNKCDFDLPFDSFNRRGDKLQPYCRNCQSGLHKDYYGRNKTGRKEQIRKRSAKYKKLARDYVLEYLDNHPCVDCGNPDRVVLEFDHVRGKKFMEVSKMVNQGYLINQIIQEINKCEVRCANCHKTVTAKRGGWYEWKFANIPR